MKKLIVLVIAVGFMFTFTQNVYSDGYGIKGGMNVAKISNLEDEDELIVEGFKTKTGFIFGFFYRFDLNNNLALQPEVYYSMKGTQASGSGVIYGLGYSYDLSIEINYLEVPVLLKYKILPKGNYTPSLFAGPYIAFQMSAKASATVEVEGVTQTEETVMDEVKRIDLGITVGGSLDIKVGSGSIVLDLRYSLGLTKIADDSDAKNSSFTLMLGYAFK